MAVPIIIMAGVAAASAIYGGVKSAKAKKEAARLAANRPKLSDSPFLRDNIRLAQSELSNSRNSPGFQAYEQGQDRNISSSLGAILKGGGSVNNVASIFDASDQGRQRMALMQDNLRLNQIQSLTNAGGASEIQRQQRFQFNDVAPWMDAAQAASAARAAGEKQMWDGIISAGSTIAGGFNSGPKTPPPPNPSMSGPTQLNGGSTTGQAAVGSRYGNPNAYTNMQSVQPYQNQSYTPPPRTYQQPHINSSAYISPNYANGIIR